MVMECTSSSMMLFLAVVLSVVCGGGTLPTHEFKKLINEGEMAMNNEAFISLIVPGVQSTHKFPGDGDTISELNKEIKALKTLMDYYAKGYSDKELTFNIYDDTMRKAAISLFHYFQNVDEKSIRPYKLWSKLDQKLNEDLLGYAMRLATLYSYKFDREMLPPFITKPNYFVNSDTISKAAQLILENDLFWKNEAKSNEYYRTDDIISINSNYSGWNSSLQECGAELNYFREDIGLNSYYYGLHLLHPFWMTNAELDEFDPRHAERYYFAHQQLMARYSLEKQHLKADVNENCQDMYHPQLIYDNGLPFPTRAQSKKEPNEGRTYLTTLDIAMRECISRGFMMMVHTTAESLQHTRLNLTEDNHIDILAKLVRANFDGIKAAKISRALYGYGGDLQLMDEYNPTPSVLHHPQTTLRDPSYWSLIQYILNYFTDYKKSLAPLNLTSFETDDFVIIKADIPNLFTHYSYYEFDIGKALQSEIKSPLTFTARQRRLNHAPFTFNFKVESKVDSDVIVRLFIGPQCEADCWDQYSKFYELDNFIYQLRTGVNNINWSPSTSCRLAGDYSFNAQKGIQTENTYSMFKFPESLILPKGTEEGINMTLFVMVTADDALTFLENDPENHFYQTIPIDFDNKPFGFPFHRPAVGFNHNSLNYKLFNITIYHKQTLKDGHGKFSPNLY